MDDRRRQSRKYLTYFSRVTDQETGIMLGYLVDMTTGGALLVGNISLELNALYDLRVDLPDNFPNHQLAIRAKPVWIQPDTDPELYRIGLQLINISPMDLMILERLLNTYGSQP